jgi:hypothetical protein
MGVSIGEEFADETTLPFPIYCRRFYRSASVTVGWLLLDMLTTGCTSMGPTGKDADSMPDLDQVDEAAVHEAYRLFGCHHGGGQKKIQATIARISRAVIKNMAEGADSVPGVNRAGTVYRSRPARDRRFGFQPASATKMGQAAVTPSPAL